VNVFGTLKINEPTTTDLNFKNPFELFKKIYYSYSNAFLLESMESDSGLSRYSFLGFDPIATIKAHGNVIEVEKDGVKEEFDTSNPFNEIKNLTKIENGRKGFSGGLVGYISYESVRFLEAIQLESGKSPDFEFGLFLDGIIFDRKRNKCEYVTLGENRIDAIKDIEKDDHHTENLKYKPKGQYFTKEEFEDKVVQVKEKITAGEVFQTVISNAFEYKINGDKLSFYEKLRNMNPSPYMYHLKLPNHEIIGSSPEMLVKVENRNLETYPIAGTRKRGLTPEMDKKLENDLLNDLKERAEHLMLVDLARNDIGKVSEFSTVKIPEFMTVKKFSHVQHIVSKVTGKLQKDRTSVDALGAIFPAGTVSGAPKIRSMEIIDELEQKPRGPYAGAVGYFSLNGNADFAITIRTLVCDGKNAKIQAGAGIVHDSVPENEYFECENKALALFKAMEMAGEADDSDNR